MRHGSALGTVPPPLLNPTTPASSAGLQTYPVLFPERRLGLLGAPHLTMPSPPPWHPNPPPPQGSNLFYFRSAAARRPLGVVPLERASIAAERLLLPPGPGAPPRGLYTLQVALAPEAAARHPHAAYLLAAPSPELQARGILGGRGRGARFEQCRGRAGAGAGRRAPYLAGAHVPAQACSRPNP
jgi:hypothetical protein